jgi:putative hemolysin
VLEPGEKEMIAGVMRLGDRPVGAVMTPRREVDMIDLTDDPTDICQILTESPHSRLPAYDDDRDHPIGIVQAKDLLNAYMSGETPDIRSLVRQAPVIPESADARDVVAILKDSPVHMGLVYDEYGAFQGVVTSADILESIVGGFKTEEGPAEEAAVQRDDGSYLISGWMPVDEFADLLSIPIPDIRSYHTVAGFVLQDFGSLPDVGASFARDGWRFEVMDMDGRRIDKILASRLEAQSKTEPQQPEASLRDNGHKRSAQAR